MDGEADLAELLRGDLAGLALAERRMFGGLCLLLGGHMVCGVMRDFAMVRVGRAAEPVALALPGVTPMRHGGRRMTGIVRAEPAALADAAVRRRLLALALDTVRALPPKPGRGAGAAPPLSRRADLL